MHPNAVQYESNEIVPTRLVCIKFVIVVKLELTLPAGDTLKTQLGIT